MRKGNLVRFDRSHEDVERCTDWNVPHFTASRPITRDEVSEWRERRRQEIKEAREAGEDTFHIAFNDAGESRLPPKCVNVDLPIDGIFVVERARCRVSLGWGNPTPGMTKILDTTTGEVAFVNRNCLIVVQ